VQHISAAFSPLSSPTRAPNWGFKLAASEQVQNAFQPPKRLQNRLPVHLTLAGGRRDSARRGPLLLGGERGGNLSGIVQNWAKLHLYDLENRLELRRLRCAVCVHCELCACSAQGIGLRAAARE